MKRILLLALLITAGTAITASAQTAQAGPPPGAGSGAGANFVDADGDGICDLFQTGQGGGRKAQAGKRGGYGPGDGSGHQGVGPRDGTGYGPGAQSGNCTGTGPQGSASRGRRGGRG